jgi:hypothetical protein
MEKSIFISLFNCFLCVPTNDVKQLYNKKKVVALAGNPGAGNPEQLEGSYAHHYTTSAQ